MASSTLLVAVFVAITFGYIETRPQNFDLNQTINGGGSNWKKDPDYLFKWEGAFNLGLPEHATCPLVLQPENGRFVCSVGTLLERSMCLVECKKGFEQTKPPVVYLCDGGKWSNLHHQQIATPEPQCEPKTQNIHHFAD